MRIALVQQTATADREANRRKGLVAVEQAARKGAQLICFAELAFEPFYPQNPAEGDVADGQICAVTTYCNGGWDSDLRARHAAEAPMIRP